MYKIEITADSLSELAGRALALAVQLRGATDPAMPHVVVTHVSKPAPEPVAAPEPAPEPEQAPDTAERLRTLILATVATKGRETVAAMLEQFGVARGSQLSPEQAAEMIEMLS